jgi:DnaJ-class molecular chaperone
LSNPYAILGVEPTATAEEITKAYRRLARKLHPDLNPGDKDAEEKFKDVANANRLLGNAEKRKRFDAGELDETGAEKPQQRYYRDYAAPEHANPYASDEGYGDFAAGDDAFADLLRRATSARANRRGQDLRYTLLITLTESIAGVGKRLGLPSGDTLDVTIPPGIVDGQTLRLKGKGAPGTGNAGPGDALIEVQVLPDPRFVREGDDLSLEWPVSLAEAVLGASIRVPTPTGEVSMTMAPGAISGAKLRLKGNGVPRRGGGRGDQFVRLRIVLPKEPDPELLEFVANWKAGKAFNPREERVG